MVTDFVGRETELSDLAKLLAAARLVTVTGTGGVGKTTLSLRAAAEAVEGYADGAWIVELSGLRDPALLPNTVASRLGLPEQDDRPPVEAVLDHLRGRHMLLIFDTCEHLIDACAVLTEAILRAAPRVTLLATSRQPLDVSGEHTFPIAPLPQSDAMALFELRARAARPGFEVGDANQADVAWICQRLDGIPLAIELAAVQLRVLSVPELAGRLGTHFAMHAAGWLAGTAVPRHQTLRRAIEWSYELCSPLERALWERLSVFAGSFDLEAVAEVCAESEPEHAEILEALIGLVEKSVATREPPGSEWYRLLDTIREFGAEQLAASGQEPRWRGRHVGRYLRLARHFRDRFTSDEQLALYHHLRDEHANIRAALEYALEDEDGSGDQGEAAGRALAGEGIDLVNDLALYWMISGRLREGGYWLGKVLGRFPGRCAERAATLVTRGLLRSFQGNVTGSIADCREAIAIAADLGDEHGGPWFAARGYLHMNLSLTFSGRHAEAEEAGDEARRRLTACGDRVGLLMLACQLGHLYQLTGRLDETVATCTAGLELLGAGSRERWLQSYLYIVSALALFQVPGREDECAAYATRALEAKHELGDIAGIAYAMDTLGWLAARGARFERCAWLLGAADPLWVRVGSRFGGTELMEQLHQQIVGAARAALGDSRYDELVAEATRRPLDEIVSVTVLDADELPRATAS
jgi:non-specific serine/threonine protein kinase